MKWLSFIVGSVLLVAVAVFTAVKFGSFRMQRLEQEVQRLQQDRRRLMEYAQRLSATRRVAQVEVLRQRRNEAGQTVNTLQWQELGADGTLGRPVTLEALGSQVYFEALVIKFEPHFVGEGDPERGASLALFRRVFGDQQTAESAPEIDRAARPPVSDPTKPAALQDELWARFWEMIDQPELAARYGVRIAQCEAPSRPVKEGQILEVSLDAAGGVNLKLVGTRTASERASAGETRRATP